MRARMLVVGSLPCPYATQATMGFCRELVPCGAPLWFGRGPMPVARTCKEDT